MHYLYNSYLLDELNEERRREAAHQRLLVSAGIVKPRRRHNYNPVLNWLGAKMTEAGHRLQNEYGQKRELSFR